MEKERLIIDLILQDLRHNQLLSGLEGLGLEVNKIHYLSILEIVSQLMKVPDKISDDWGALYIEYMNQAIHYKIMTSTKIETLVPLAETCYVQLRKLIDKES